MVGLAVCRESAGTESHVQTLQGAQVLTAEWCPELEFHHTGSILGLICYSKLFKAGDAVHDAVM